MIRRPITSLLIKPAGPDCNLNCDYCFYLEKKFLFNRDQCRMTDETLEELIRQGMQSSGKEVNFLWQGGEPTLMGLDFYKKVIEYQKKYGQRKIVGNGLQTNGTLINSEWCSFLKEQKFLVGLSLDGPEYVHDYHRRNINNKGSWQSVMQLYYQLAQYGVSVNILATISDHSVKHLNETYHFFKQLKAEFIQYLPILETDQDGIKGFSLKAPDYGYFLTELWKLWLIDFHKGCAPNIRTFEAIFGNYTRTGATECTFSKQCGSYLVIEHNGDIYPCDYYVNPELRSGNIHTNSIKEVLNSNQQLGFGNQKEQLNSKCKNCEYLNYCFGGCLKNRIIINGKETHNYYCESYRSFFKLAHHDLLALAKQWQEQHSKAAPKTFDASGYF